MGACDEFERVSPSNRWRSLPGPTGEATLYVALPRRAVLCVGREDADLLVQLAAVLAVGSRSLWPMRAQELRARLPEEVRERIVLHEDWERAGVEFDAALVHGDRADRTELFMKRAARPGAILGVAAMNTGSDEIPLERLVVERALSFNTAAASENASLMALG